MYNNSACFSAVAIKRAQHESSNASHLRTGTGMARRCKAGRSQLANYSPSRQPVTAAPPGALLLMLTTLLYHSDYCSSSHSIAAQGSGVGHSAMHWCAAKGYLDCLQWLVKQGADINSLNAEDSTPLHAAAANGKEGIVHYLLAQPNITRESLANFVAHPGCLCISLTWHLY